MQPRCMQEGGPFVNFRLKVSLSALILAQFDTVILNVLSTSRDLEEHDTAGSSRVNFDQFWRFSSHCAEFSILGDLDTDKIKTSLIRFILVY